jgi:hypothetical protein
MAEHRFDVLALHENAQRGNLIGGDTRLDEDRRREPDVLPLLAERLAGQRTARGCG